MTVQVITRDGEAEYAILPWATYEALLKAAGATAPRQEPANPATPAAQASAAFDQLRLLREARGMAPEDLARSVGVSPHYLAMIESGERQPGDAIRRALAWNLGVAGWESES
ncbi:MAG: helix-turn-helix domain-containing protein [Pseudomonas sp.]